MDTRGRKVTQQDQGPAADATLALWGKQDIQGRQRALARGCQAEETLICQDQGRTRKVPWIFDFTAGRLVGHSVLRASFNSALCSACVHFAVTVQKARLDQMAGERSRSKCPGSKQEFSPSRCTILNPPLENDPNNPPLGQSSCGCHCPGDFFLDTRRKRRPTCRRRCVVCSPKLPRLRPS